MSGALPPHEALAGLPDFQASLGGSAVQVFAPFGNGPYAVLPSGATLASRNGVPAFSLTLVKQTDQPGPTGNYATLDIALTENTPLDDGLALARQAYDAATVAPVSLDLGFARLTQSGAGLPLPADLTAPVPLGWSASGGARWTHQLAVDTAEIIKKALLDGTLLFGAEVEYSVRGVAARAPASVDFVPSTLIAALAGSAADRTIAATALTERLLNGALPMTVKGAAPSDQVAQAMADRLAGTFGTLVPAGGPGQSPCWRLPDGATTERVTWDLSAPAAGLRAYRLTLGNSAVVSPAVAPSLIHEVSIPALDLGFRDIVVEANLPANRVGIPVIGVRIVLPPHPPGRPSGINRTVQFSGATDIVRTTIQIDPNEPLAYTAIPFVVIAAGGLVAQIDGAPIAATDPWLRVPTGTFPLAFTHIVASDRLLGAAKVAGALTYTSGGKAARQSITLSSGTADVALGVPNGVVDAALSLTATASDGAVATLATPKLGTIRIDISSFPGYGPHRIPIRARFGANAAPLVIELATEDGTTHGTVTLIPGSPDATWGYVAPSPFHAGFRMRPAGGTWSPVLTPPRRINLKGDGTMDDDFVEQDDMTVPSPPFDLPGAHFVPSADGSTISYIPDMPGPELDGAGQPTLSLLSMPQMTTLQLGAQFGLSADQLTAVAALIAKQTPALATARLQPAMIGVSKAALIMVNETGAEVELANSKTSAFPPYAAVFSASLPPDRAAAAISAVRGRHGVLFVDYTIAPMSGDPAVKRTDIATWFSGTDGDAHIRVAG